MSRHEGVSCDACMRGNFKGRRFKCLKCYDYDLCANCYEAGASTPRHSVDHPMQCILTRADFELYYGGESLASDQPQAFTCPFCGRMGLTEAVLTEHVSAEHPDSTAEVVCPVCAAHPGGDPNLLTDDFSVHLQMQHRASPNVPRDLISFLDEPTVARHSVRRIPQSSRGMGSTRVRRAINFRYRAANGGARDGSDPIAELLSQLSGVRRAQSSSVPGSSASSSQGGHSANNVSSQLQQLQMQLQLERQQVRAARQQLERLPRRQGHSSSAAAASLANNNVVGSGVPTQATGTSSNLLNIQVVESNANQNQTARNNSSQFLIKYIDAPLTESEQQKLDVDRADRSFFMQELLLSMLTPNATISTQTKKDHATSAQPQVSQAITRPNVPDIEQRQPNTKSSTPPPSQQQTTNHITDMPHRFSSPPSRNRQTIMQSQIPQPSTNVRKQPKVTDNPPSH